MPSKRDKRFNLAQISRFSSTEKYLERELDRFADHVNRLTPETQVSVTPPGLSPDLAALQAQVNALSSSLSSLQTTVANLFEEPRMFRNTQGSIAEVPEGYALIVSGPFALTSNLNLKGRMTVL